MYKVARKLTYEEVKCFIETESGSGCKLLSEEYVNCKAKILLKGIIHKYNRSDDY